jgi:2-polyprenyl-3-methyl-5-hydroxy-6-metoxy-1,4-benzoquinol methylase
MKNNKDLKNTYNKIASDWVRDHSSDDWWVEGTDIFLSLLSPGATILDVGCGGGHKTQY